MSIGQTLGNLKDTAVSAFSTVAGFAYPAVVGIGVTMVAASAAAYSSTVTATGAVVIAALAAWAAFAKLSNEDSKTMIAGIAATGGGLFAVNEGIFGHVEQQNLVGVAQNAVTEVTNFVQSLPFVN